MGAMYKALLAMTIIGWLAGGALLGLGVWLYMDDPDFSKVEIIDPEADKPLIWVTAITMMMATGSLVFAVGFVGWVGAWKEHSICLLAYIIINSIAMGAMVAGGSLAIAYDFQVGDDDIRNQMFDHLVGNETGDPNSKYTEVWDRYQSEYHCCGVDSYTDWQSNQYYDEVTEPPVPDSCCVLGDLEESGEVGENDTVVTATASSGLLQCYLDAQGNDTESSQSLYTTPCFDVLVDKVNGDAVINYAMSFAVTAINIAATALAGVYRNELTGNKIGPNY